MLSITVSQDQLDYVGLLATPALGLLSQPDRVVSGLYHAFLGMHSGLADFQSERETGTALADTIVVNLGNRGSYRFDYERIEWTNPDAGASELDVSALARGDAWLRSALPEMKFQHHYYTYSAHCQLESGSARSFLLGLKSPHLADLGDNQGTGLIFHATLSDQHWAVRITLDHSNAVAEGLYVQWVAAITQDQVPHQQTVRNMDERFRGALAQLGLNLIRYVG